VNIQAPHDPTADDIARWLRVTTDPGAVIELRILNAVDNPAYPPFTVSGYYEHDHIDKLAKAAMAWTGKAEGVYVTVNPVMPDLLARSVNRPTRKPKHTTTDAEIARRIGLVFDADPRRPAGVSATDPEKALSQERIDRLVHDLTGRGWPLPIVADSGNGYHARYVIDLPADDGGLLEHVLKAADQLLSDDQVKIDTSLFNPARIIKLYGTMARKGDSTDDRPHRWSRVLSVPDPIDVVLIELLEAFAAEYQPPAPVTKASRSKPQAAAKERVAHDDATRDDDGLLPGDDFEARATWEEILEVHGWTKDREIGGETRWTRPGKDGGTSATTGHNAGFHVYIRSKSELHKVRRLCPTQSWWRPQRRRQGSGRAGIRLTTPSI
jgi:hypothetical protein